MSPQITQPPAATPATVYPLQEHARRAEAALSNRRAVEALVDYTGLPAPRMVARHDAVFITVTDLDEVGQWLLDMGGVIHCGPEFEGVAVWTLHTLTAARADGSSVPVRVSVLVLVDESVMPYIRAAVAA